MKKGQSLPEYALVLALVVVAVIVGLIALGGNINGIFLGTDEGMDSAKFQIAMAQGGGNASLKQLLADAGYTGETKTITFQTEDGQTITIEDYPVELSQNIDTLGANGTGKLMSQVMKTIAQKLVDEGVVSETDALLSLIHI